MAMKRLTIETKKKIERIFLSVVFLLVLAGMVINILTREGLMEVSFIRGIQITFDGLQKFIEGNGAVGILIYLFIYVLVATTTTFVPMTAFGTILLGVRLFKETYGLAGSFAITLGGVVLAGTLLYILGRFGGRKIGNFILGEEDIDKATRLLETKGQVYLPLMLMFPMFPDDALCFAAGMIKMKWWYFLLVTIVFRGIGVFTINLIGGELGDIVVELLNVGSIEQTIMNWFIFITAVAFWLIVIFYIANKLDKFLEKKRQDKIK